MPQYFYTLWSSFDFERGFFILKHVTAPSAAPLQSIPVGLSAVLIAVYLLLYPPLIFIDLIDPDWMVLRIGIEFFSVLSLLALSGWSVQRRTFFLLIGVMSAYTIHAAFNIADLRNSLSSCLKFVYALLLYDALRHFDGLRRALVKIWLFALSIASFSAIILWTKILSGATYVEVHRSMTSLGIYQYFSSGPFGFFLERNLASFSSLRLPRFTWYVTEPGQLSVFFLFSALVCTQMLKKNWLCYPALILALIGGIATMSVTFVALYAAYIFATLTMYFMKKFDRTLFGIYFLLTSGSAALALLFLKRYDISSGLDRWNRLNGALQIIPTMSVSQLLFGSGTGHVLSITGRGSSNGFIDLFIEQGLFTSVIVLLILHKFLQNSGLVGLFAVLSICIFPNLYWPTFWTFAACYSVSVYQQRERLSLTNHA